MSDEALKDAAGKAPAEVLSRFGKATRQWFLGAFAAPTRVQEEAWHAISQGHHALVVAPTGSGKTLAAFLWALDRLIHGPLAGDGDTAAPAPPPEDTLDIPDLPAPDLSASGKPAAKGRVKPRTKVLYISPLKALGVDVERNLRAPLIGITQTAKGLGLPAPNVSVGVRSGDTPANERRKLLSHPPDILITTPESLFLMLTSSARETLTGVDTVILDEVHAVAGTKRGAHLAVSLERLDALLDRPAQRIGLSATVEPRDLVARFLGGESPVSVVAPPASKTWELTVSVPVEDMSDLPAAASAHDLGPASGLQPQASIWPHVEEKIVDHVLARRSTIVFANSRRLAERLTARLNEIYAERQVESAWVQGTDEDGLDGGLADGGLPDEGLPRPAAEAVAAAVERLRDGEGLRDGENPRNGAPASTATPAHMMAQAGQTTGAEPILARAHHGSVSKEQRAQIEDDLKSGRLRCVVATSSLELGIDMGAVDLVIQVESPPSVASALQRVGRAGHQVGEVSQGVLFPKHRADLVHTAVTVERMTAGKIERLSIPQNPLDILAQQTVAATALGPIDVEQWFSVVRRSAPFSALPRGAFNATLDLLAGRYPSDEFSELRPRIIWDRNAGTIEGRPGAQRLAVVSGGTIPDRGLFGVYLVGEEDSKSSKRVGELDEEMVYESRVGDVFALGATSWRIEDITFDRVLVTPAFGQPGKLPFWKGDSLGRPLELGQALGAFIREVSGADESAAVARCEGIGLDSYAAGNLVAYLTEQQQSTTVVPNDRALLVERFHDELGDWRVVLHSPFGMPVHAPWALAVGRRLQERYGLDGSVMAADDGIVLRVPLMEDEPPGAELFLFEPEELERIVTEEVGGSALFASRFRECAARALLLPRQTPGKRQPLWQQRQRAAQLLDVAKKYPQFPIVLETVRECLQDVYDLPALQDVAGRIERREIQISETTTSQPSPFARSLLFGYVAQFLYEGDSPLAERRAAALSLDSGLLNELLGRVELRELLDPAVVEQTGLELQRLLPDRRLRGVEGTADLLRLLGPLTVPEIAERLQDPQDAEEHARQLVATGRALRFSLRGREHLAAVEDSARLRDGLGVPLPMGVPLAFLEPVADPLGDLVGRYARTHGPFTTAELATHLGLGTAVVLSVLKRLATDGRVVEGEFRPHPELVSAPEAAPADDAVPPGDAAGVSHSEAFPDPSRPGGASTGETARLVGGQEWCDAEVLRRLRRRSLAALRAEVEPVDAQAFGRFLPSWQNVGTSRSPAPLRGLDGVLTVVDQLAGVPIPASAWETLVLPARIRDYAPTLLDELMASGEVLWTGTASLPGNDGWISLHLAESAALTVNAAPEFEPTAAQERLLEHLAGGGAYFFRPLKESAGGLDSVLTDEEMIAELWGLVWAGRVTGDTFAPVRALLAGGGTAHKQAPRPSRARPLRRSRLGGAGGFPGAGLDGPGMATVPPLGAGRWSAVMPQPLDPTVRAHALAELLLDRYGVLTRGSVVSEQVPGGFALLYRILSKLEESGRTRRGYFIEKLGAAQFSVPATVDRLRSFSEDGTILAAEDRPHTAVTLAATDPANPYGAALPWPTLDGAASGHRPGRKAGALVVLVDGRLILYVERGGKTLLGFTEDEALLTEAASSLVTTVRRGAVDRLAMEKVNGRDLLDTPLSAAFLAAGAYSTPRGVRIRA
ncbi:ATP-dependent helicase [Arthrobacter woluwensis]|uniref:DNA glycosylase AlkZ-like family protein n=1 Tax=Arthrobacter woluwensis TaxID=156980 RepID=UPI000D13D64D|nr:crosslink repair DNA glycosylase YcaQ family protein [Arthrobacter woluwensis]PSS43677.1 ATP-dependent helicase [Arthrobacter woluwensis]